jgi:hypothetical protein
MKHFSDILNMQHFHKHLQNHLLEDDKRIAQEARAEAILASMGNDKEAKAAGGANNSAFQQV